MTIEEVIHKLDFSIKGYQKLIDEHVSDGQVVGTGVRGEWSANTPLNAAYQSHIDAYEIAKDIVENYNNRLKSEMAATLKNLLQEIETLSHYESADGQELVMLADIGNLLYGKINSLTEDDTTNADVITCKDCTHYDKRILGKHAGGWCKYFETVRYDEDFCSEGATE